MFDWPMSSPQMMTMLGLAGVCALAGAATLKALAIMLAVASRRATKFRFMGVSLAMLTVGSVYRSTGGRP